MDLSELKAKSPSELLSLAEKLEIEDASGMKKQNILVAILRKLTEKEDTEIKASGVIEVLKDGFGFLRSVEENYLPGPDDIYVSIPKVRKNGLRTGDTVEGVLRAPREGERYFSLSEITAVNFDKPENTKHRINFDNLTPLTQRIKLN